MTISFRKLHSHFVAEASDVRLRDEFRVTVLEEIRRAMDEHAVLVFRDQEISLAEQLAFAERFDGRIHRATSAAAVGKGRHGDEGLADIGNIDASGEVMATDDRRRINNLGNRLWHTDASFVDPCGRYSMLSARVVPSTGADTEFADTRAAYDALDPDRQAKLEGLTVFHSVVHSRSLLGFQYTESEQKRLPGAIHPLVRTNPGSGRRSLHLASHASHIVGWPVPEGRLLLLELMEHATRREFVYVHRWHPGDFVIWDNRATMHRATAFDEFNERRELVRTTTLDYPHSIQQPDAPAISSVGSTGAATSRYRTC